MSLGWPTCQTVSTEMLRLQTRDKAAAEEMAAEAATRGAIMRVQVVSHLAAKAGRSKRAGWGFWKK